MKPENPRHCQLPWSRVAFWLTGFIALFWFLVRVIPKPSRAAYPCQQAAFPLASAFVISLCAASAGLAAFLRHHRFTVLATVMLASGLILGLTRRISANEDRPPAVATSPALPKWTPALGPNSPIGEAKGIHPGRVTWCRDLRATPWDGKTGKWWDAGNINQDALDAMFAKSLRALAGGMSDTEAWARLIRWYNKTHDRGDAPRQPGETIAVKINLNNTYGGYGDADNDIDQSPQSVRTLLHQLTRNAGFAETEIIIYDASPNGMRRAIPDRMYGPLASGISRRALDGLPRQKRPRKPRVDRWCHHLVIARNRARKRPAQTGGRCHLSDQLRLVEGPRDFRRHPLREKPLRLHPVSPEGSSQICRSPQTRHHRAKRPGRSDGLPQPRRQDDSYTFSTDCMAPGPM